MSCCGSSRNQAAAAAPDSRGGDRAAVRGWAIAPIEYVGDTALTVLGPATGRCYRFPYSGFRQRVDPRDWAALARLPQLRPA